MRRSTYLSQTAAPADIFVCMFSDVEEEVEDGGVILKSQVFQIIKYIEDFDVFLSFLEEHVNQRS